MDNVDLSEFTDEDLTKLKDLIEKMEEELDKKEEVLKDE